jgi:nucleotide-binding universal stress UspA family protein
MIQRILVPTDFSEPAELALRHARALAERLGAELRLLTSTFVSLVWGADAAVPLPESYLGSVRERARRDLEERAAALRSAGLRASCAVSPQPAVQAICALAASWPADLIAMGTHGRTGLPHALLGSTTERSLQLAVSPVLTLRGGIGEPRPVRNVLVATDFSAHSRSTIDWAGELADRTGARLALVHALPRSGGDADDARERLEALRKEFSGVIGEVVAEPGEVDEVVFRSARRLGSDWIAVGTRGLSGLDHVLFGSNAERIVRRAPVPVAVVKRP